MGSFVSRVFVMVLGYAYPAFECFKAVENNESETKQLLSWCKYWLPMYTAAKMGVLMYLWYPRAKGTTHVYDSFLRPYLKEHREEIDRSLLELKVNARIISVIYWEKAASYGKCGFFKIMQYFSHMIKSRPHDQVVGDGEVFAARQECSRAEKIIKEHRTESSGLFEKQHEASGVHKRIISSQSVTETIGRSPDVMQKDTGETESLVALRNGNSGSSQKKVARPRRRGMWRIFKICNIH